MSNIMNAAQKQAIKHAMMDARDADRTFDDPEVHANHVENSKMTLRELSEAFPEVFVEIMEEQA